MMPISGPQGHDIGAGSQNGQTNALPYALIPVTPQVVNVLQQITPRLSTAFASRTPPKTFRFGIGDIVSVTIFEAAAGGLFTSDAGVRAGNYVTVPNQAVDDRGDITIPYAGAIRAKGLTPSEIQNEITDRLKGRALEPQVVVALAEQRTSLYSVLGDVKTAGRFPASPSGERILDAIARAGGPGNQGYDVWAALERSGHRAAVPFGALMYEPANNIYVLPNDVIFVYAQPQTFVAFGAAGNQGQFKFDAWRLSLAEALAKQGGLNDAVADPSSVFIYRGETREVARRLGVNVNRFDSKIIPVIYNVNLRDSSGYFLAQNFPMRNKDVLYSSNATSVEATKFLTFVRTILATVNDPVIYATNGYTLNAAIHGFTPTTISNVGTPINTTSVTVNPAAQ
ncbi:polysaccharide export protein [Rhodoblastus acidophilus]|uniref:Polysaccharide export protein n=1 Tax=Candidatus Rhodoblastus alkanivorans TaxID=2954117 RepID=A0ABS9Z9Z9_9HYPH|nr:polysaccharide biosynthesis/export family protein [Candidatus Rhodoblastus alkanivorans]MCI4677064.1 polysaccharide export protein [Candidatus Rhodoblastus alkanivorans]MCI4684417.1 polysaccharide export protein [Candidatus Rhodoblastus alkanivorans]MDI4641738.1 polysaccharide export protein [Rhodoblastus acidophilus]